MAPAPLEQHVRYVGILTLAWAGITALAALVAITLVAFGVAAFEAADATALGAATIAAVVITILAAVAVFQFVAGWALLKGLTWGRPLTMAVAIVALFSFPFGTAYGIYALWVLTRPGVKTVIDHRHRPTDAIAA